MDFPLFQAVSMETEGSAVMRPPVLTTTLIPGMLSAVEPARSPLPLPRYSLTEENPHIFYDIHLIIIFMIIITLRKNVKFL